MGQPDIALILEGLLGRLCKFSCASPAERFELAGKVSEYCNRSLKKHDLPVQIEEIFVECLDLDHWGEKKLPPTLTLKGIRGRLIPKIENLAGKLQSN